MKGNQAKEYYSLQEIAKWQTEAEHSDVELPKLQRGFVWKPKQVEDLWDSLLRGYPIGSFLFSSTGDKFYLMDGQQRATSIFLGLYNPYLPKESTEAWSIKGELPVVWLDINTDTKPNSSRFLFRLTTKSHPWGYQAKNNRNILSTSNRRKALSLFRKHSNNTDIGYTKFSNTTTFPFDSSYPIPLSFLIEANTVDEVVAKVNNSLPEYFKTMRGNFENKKEFVELLKTDLHSSLEKLLREVKSLDVTKIKYNTIEDRVLREENNESDPTLFVRINSSGTTLTGDDLIYSIYKSIYPESKDLIEKIAANFIKPTQVLSLVSRITASKIENDSYIKKMNVRDFQRRIKNDSFKKELGEMITNQVFENLFQGAITILSCRNNPLFDGEIPSVVIKQAVKKKQNLFLFLLYWLHRNCSELSNETKLKISGKFFTFVLFEFSNEKRLWEEYVEDKDFWNNSINHLMWWDNKDGIHFLLDPNLLYDYYLQPSICEMFKREDEHRWGLWEDGVGTNIIKYYDKVKDENFNIEKANEFFWKMIGVLRNNRQLILIAQRDYINNTFGDYNQMDNIEDTNAPWDWDHIYPSEWVYNMKKCNKGIREWNNTNGNYRAISLEDNRRRGNKQPPCDINTEEERQYSYILDNDWVNWKEIYNRIWDNNIENHFNAIVKRMINIYAKFWKDFKINEMIELEEQKSDHTTMAHT